MAKGYTLILEDEPLPARNIVVTIYGEPGCAKTSLAFTAENTLLLDFDGGVERSVGRTKVIKMDSWSGVIECVDDNTLQKHNIKTLVCDTAERMLKYMGDFVISQNPKNAKSDGSLGITGYGAIKSNFENFLNRLSKLNVDLVVIAHATTEKEDDKLRFIPKVTGGSYDILLGLSDLVGYLEVVGNDRVLDFNPRDRHFGKNSPRFDKLKLPHHETTQWTGYLGRLIQKTKDKMGEMNAAQVAAVKKLDEVNSKILDCQDVECLESLYSEIEVLSPIYRAQVSLVFDKRYLEAWTEKIESAKNLDAIIDLKQPLNGIMDKFKSKLLPIYQDTYLERWKSKYFKNAKNAEDFNSLVAFANDAEKNMQKPIKQAIAKQAETLNLVYDKEKTTFKLKEGPKEEKPEETVKA